MEEELERHLRLLESFSKDELYSKMGGIVVDRRGLSAKPSTSSEKAQLGRELFNTQVKKIRSLLCQPERIRDFKSKKSRLDLAFAMADVLIALETGIALATLVWLTIQNGLDEL